MNRWLTIIAWVTACLTSFFALFIYFSHKNLYDNFTCQGEVISKGNNTVVRHFVSVKMEHARGRFDIVEQFTPSDSRVNKKVVSTLLFHFSRNENRVMMISETENQYADFLRTETNVPDFFLRQDRGLALRMIPINKNAYLFIDGETPVFYCKKTDTEK